VGVGAIVADPRVEVELLTAETRRLVMEPVEQPASVTLASRRRHGREVVDIQIVAPSEAVCDPETRDRHRLRAAVLEDADEAVSLRALRVVHGLDEVLLVDKVRAQLAHRREGESRVRGKDLAYDYVIHVFRWMLRLEAVDERNADLRAVVLVEGVSDQAAVEALAERRGRDLDAEGVSVVPIGGAQAIGRYLHHFGPRGLDLELAGLCDAAEEIDFRRGLERAGLGAALNRGDMEELGFYVCVEDLEDELIRAHGADGVERVVDAHGDLGRFRTLQKQPEWRGRPPEEQLKRFMGSGGRRKIRYARFLVESLDLASIPRPLERVLTHV
jgi:hypothetical protein